MNSRIVFAAAWACLSMTAAQIPTQPAPEWPVVFRHTLRGKVDNGWSWVREKPEATRTTQDGIQLQMLSGTLWAKDNSGANLLVRPMPSTNAVVTEVTLNNDPALLNEQAGLIWYGGDDDYIKLVKEMKDQPFIILGREEQQAAKTFGRIAMPSRTVTLRLTSHEGRVQAHARVADGAWQFVGECAPLKTADLRAGVFASVQPGGTDRWASFSDFVIRAPGSR